MPNNIIKRIKSEIATEKLSGIMEGHTMTGYRILNLFNETMDIAEVVLVDHDRVDGSALSHDEAIEDIRSKSGSKFLY